MNNFLNVILRLVLYALLFLVDYFLIYLDIQNGEVKEYSTIEFSQELLLFLMVGLMLLNSCVWCKFRSLSIITSLVFAIHVTRELDHYLDLLFDGLWQIIVLVFLSIAIYIFVKNRKLIISQIGYLKNDLSIGILLVGFTLLHVFSRLWGKSENWESLLKENYIRVVKDMAEEGVELLAYTVLFIGTFELLITLKRLRKKDHAQR
jgi:hypothetical protein